MYIRPFRSSSVSDSTVTAGRPASGCPTAETAPRSSIPAANMPHNRLVFMAYDYLITKPKEIPTFVGPK